MPVERGAGSGDMAIIRAMRASMQFADCGGRRLLGHRPRSFIGYAIALHAGVDQADGAVAQNQKRPPVWAAVEEGVTHSTYLRAGGVHRAPVSDAATV